MVMNKLENQPSSSPSSLQQQKHQKNPKPLLINPNWAALQSKLKTRRMNSSESNLDSGKNTQLGKRKERPELDSSSVGTSVLTPSNSDCSLTDVVAMDCEMVGVSSQGNKSALARVTLVNIWGNIIYDEYVRPLERVVDFRSEISGIRPHNLRKAKDFWIVQKAVADFIKGRILVGHALHNDLKALLLGHPKKDIRDTSEYEPFKRSSIIIFLRSRQNQNYEVDLNLLQTRILINIYNGCSREGRKRALRDLAAQFLGIKIQQGEHCPIEDARAVMIIYQKHKKEWERSIKQQMRFRKNHKNRKKKKRLEDGSAKADHSKPPL